MSVLTEDVTYGKVLATFQNNFTKFTLNVDNLFIAEVTKERLWETYVNSFPEEDGLRQSFVCNSCRQFIENYGGLVKIENNKTVSIWRFTTGTPLYQHTVDNLANLVESSSIRNIFIPAARKLGLNSNIQLLEDRTTIKWEHWALELPSRFSTYEPEFINSRTSNLQDSFSTLKRGFQEITADSVKVALELIQQNSLESGTQFKNQLESFLKTQKSFKSLKGQQQDNFCWSVIATNPVLAKTYNSAIGTFLKDLSKGVDIETAVVKFGKVMNPYNYKRPLAIITQRTIDNAEKKIKQLGLENSLARRLAVTEDVSINNMIWANRSTQTLETKGSSIFDRLKEEVADVNPQKFNKLREVAISDFINTIVPKASSIKILLENKHASNLVSLIAPVDLDSPPITKWDNGYTWVYTGGLADSVKERIKAQGGRVEGELRCSLSWYNYDDLDIHVTEPSREKIYYGNKKSGGGGELDVDMNADDISSSREAVENIIYPFNNRQMLEGKYIVKVHNYALREHQDVGFEVQIEQGGNIFTLKYNKAIKNKEYVTVAEFDYSKTDGIKFISSIDRNSPLNSKEIWGLNTNKFQDVTAIMKSPNHWENSIGNEHIFFMLKGAENKDPLIRGFFNEQLPQHLMEHKRVFEALGSKLAVEPAPSARQLSGLGFQLTKSNSFIAKVSGGSEGIIKVRI